VQVCTCTPNGHLPVLYVLLTVHLGIILVNNQLDAQFFFINSPDDGYMAARNMRRIEMNIHEKELCVKLVIYKDYTEMHGQQNIKLTTGI